MAMSCSSSRCLDSCIFPFLSKSRVLSTVESSSRCILCTSLSDWIANPVSSFLALCESLAKPILLCYCKFFVARMLSRSACALISFFCVQVSSFVSF